MPFVTSNSMTEGGIASRFPGATLKWNSLGLKFDLAEANQFVRGGIAKD